MSDVYGGGDCAVREGSSCGKRRDTHVKRAWLCGRVNKKYRFGGGRHKMCGKDVRSCFETELMEIFCVSRDVTEF